MITICSVTLLTSLSNLIIKDFPFQEEEEEDIMDQILWSAKFPPNRDPPHDTIRSSCTTLVHH